MDKKTFPILNAHDYGGLRSIPWGMIAPQEAAAQCNHRQTLERLAERGGLDVFEVLAVLDGRKKFERNLTIGEANEELARRVRTFIETHATHIIDAMLPAARLVYEQGGWSGTSGNWPLVEAAGELETLKELAPEIYARISEKLPAKEYTDEPCTLCNGTGKSPGKTVAELQGEGFEEGKEVGQTINSRIAEHLTTKVKGWRRRLRENLDWLVVKDVLEDMYKVVTADGTTGCTCLEIQAMDPRRHFKGCPERKPLDKETIAAIETAPAEHCNDIDGHCTGDDVDCECACNGCTGMRIAKAEQELETGESKPLDEVFPSKEHPTKPEGPQQ